METFKLVFQKDLKRKEKGDVLTLYTTSEGQKMKIVEEPTHKYWRWYWKILNFLTFKFCFNERYEYICKLESDGTQS